MTTPRLKVGLLGPYVKTVKSSLDKVISKTRSMIVRCKLEEGGY